ncbi:glycosyltransferase family 4 protein [Porticoccaceae bacterium]|nr:glycosyltransferase family 4 protein [Porticoccaceae bacterium]
MITRLEQNRTKLQSQLIINWITPRPSLAGGVKSNKLIAEAMVRRGHQVNIVFVDGPSPSPSWWRIRTAFRYWLNRWKMKNRQQHHLENSIANLMPVPHERILAEHVPDADVSIATWWETAWWIKDWPDAKGKKAYFIRGHELYGGDPKLVAQTYRLPFKKLVIATWLKTLMKEIYKDDNTVLIPNGVDRAQFNYQSRSKQDMPTVGVLYGMAELKGARTAFDAIRLAQQKIPNLRVICFGSQAIRSEHRPPRNFKYYCRPSQEQIPELYRQTDCWLVPSTLEGFGMPGLEAAACGCPVISTRCGGPEDYVKEGHNGYLVDVGDVEGMAERLIKIMTLDTEEWTAMSTASYEYVKRFDWDVSAALLEQALIDDL